MADRSGQLRRVHLSLGPKRTVRNQLYRRLSYSFAQGDGLAGSPGKHDGFLMKMSANAMTLSTPCFTRVDRRQCTQKGQRASALPSRGSD